MIDEKTTIKSQYIFSDDNTHRYMLRKIWDNTKPKATVIMISPGDADNINTDLSTQLTINNLYKLNFGSCDVLNLFSKKGISPKRSKQINAYWDINTDKAILSSCDKTDVIVIAWGKIGDHNENIRARETEVLNMLKSSYLDKMYYIANSKGKLGLHPLTPSVRNHWELVKLGE